MAQFMVILDATIVNVALPSIQTDLDMSDADLQWIVNAYTLMFGGFLLLGGRAGDLAGTQEGVPRRPRRLHDRVAAQRARAELETCLIVFRGVQGLGAALVSPAALSIITTTFAEGAGAHEGAGRLGRDRGRRRRGRPRARRLPRRALSWPWIFFVNVPVGIAVVRRSSLRFVPESKDEHAHKSFDVARRSRRSPAGLVALVYGIVKAQEKGWTSLQAPAASSPLAVILLVAFVVIERARPSRSSASSIFRVQHGARARTS